tara:strand:+ start:4423 stop:4791 length:369 start_codon:yes stop_codon:yes gene_type:complete
MKDPDHLIKVEKAIQEKYGDEAIQNPKNNWDKEKEKDYISQIKEISKKQRTKTKVEVDGVLLPEKLFIKESDRTCPSCNIYSFKAKDDLYMSKFSCCFRCYVIKVEGREESWLKKLNSTPKK